MGVRFRKSVKLGPVKINFSKSGMGYSVGTKCARITKRADGKTQTTVSIPGTGISHVEVHGGGSSKAPHQKSAETSNQRKEQLERWRQERYEQNKPKPYTHISFLAAETGIKSRQEALYLFKMRRPPFDADLTFSLSETDDAPGRIGIYIKDTLIGFVPDESFEAVDLAWDRIDAVSALDVLGAKGSYAAKVFVRINKAPDEYEKELADYDASFT